MISIHKCLIRASIMTSLAAVLALLAGCPSKENVVPSVNHSAGKTQPSQATAVDNREKRSLLEKLQITENDLVNTACPEDSSGIECDAGFYKILEALCNSDEDSKGILKKLLRFGMDPDLRSFNGQHIIYMLWSNEFCSLDKNQSQALIKILLDNGADPKKGRYGSRITTLSKKSGEIQYR